MLNKWLVIGPGRTGSKVIVDYIRSHYNRTIKYYDPTTKITDIDVHSWILHSHNIGHYEYLKDEAVNLIVSTRDLVDSALSWCLLNRNKIWHRYKNSNINFSEIEPFRLDIEEFNLCYNNALTFYEGLKPYLNNKTRIIDYSQFECNNNYLANILCLEVKRPYLPIKNPDIWQWIINRGEIEGKIKNYSRGVPLYR